MKRELKGFVVGVLLASLVVSAIPTMAEKVTKSAELLYNNIKVVIDGKQADLKDAQGNTVEPFIIDGTTYLPVRAVSNALNKAVSWDGATQTVYLGKNEEIEQPSVWLKDLETFTGTAETKSVDTVEFGGNDYNNVLTSNTNDVFKNCWRTWSHNSSGEFTTYLLGYKYSKFTGTIYLSKGGKDTNGWYRRYLVYGDDKIIYTSDDIGSGSMTADFEIDVKNVNVLKIILQDKYEKDGIYGESNAGEVYIGNAGLYE